MSKCPYCKKDSKKELIRKSKCPFCREVIYLKRRVGAKNKEAVTKSEAIVIDAEWNEKHTKERWLGNLDLGEKDYQSEKKKLENDSRMKARPKDVIWALLNQLALKNTHDYRKMSQIYFAMAIFREEEGGDFVKLLQEHYKWELYDLKRSKHTKVKIIAGECEDCKKHDGEVYEISEALKAMPLPCRECTKWKKEKNSSVGWCRCNYEGIIDENFWKV